MNQAGEHSQGSTTNDSEQDKQHNKKEAFNYRVKDDMEAQDKTRPWFQQ